MQGRMAGLAAAVALAFAIVPVAAFGADNGANMNAAATQDPRAGIERAKAAGIFVDPLMEPLMAEAPIGSCINDPTQPKCPRTTAVVYAPEFFNIPESQQPPIAATAARGKASKRAARIRARAAAEAVVFNCYLKVNFTSPYLAAGYEQMDAQHYCLDTISDLDIYLVLYKYYNYQWNNMAYRWFYPTNVNAYWNGSLRYACVSSVTRNWLAKASSYVIYKGVYYAAVSQRQATNGCG
jgi:hypothetical protein